VPGRSFKHRGNSCANHSLRCSAAALLWFAPELHFGRDKVEMMEMPPKNTLIGPDGQSYVDFRKTLTPRYGRVWAEIVAGHVALWGSLAVILAAGPRWGWLLVIPIACAVGYAMAFLQLYFHEAAHFLLASTKANNDRLANAFIGLLVGQDIAAYRVVHFDHHRHLGTTEDTERGYFESLSIGFIAESALLLRVFKFLMARGPRIEKQAKTPRQRLMLLGGISMHGGLLLALAGIGAWPAILAWIIGMASIFPLFASIRPLLEHRDVAASRDKDYAKEDHGEVHRLFSDGPIASTLGGAGFNRHLLHHWEPQISCTRLAELEAFLSKTNAAPVLDAARSDYRAVFVELLRAS
jgi:fatty acid desaturase